MRKTTFAVALAALLITAAAGTFSTKLVEANPFPPPITEITIENPQNTSYNVNTIVLFFSAKSVSFFPNSIFYYSLDGGERKLIVNRTTVSEEFLPINPGIYVKSVTGNSTLGNLSEGWHNVTVYDIRHLNNDPKDEEIIYLADAKFKIDTTPPIVSILSLENKTYYSPELQLVYTVNDGGSEVAYSLDGQENVTIAGNITLNNLPNGDHNLKFFANDEAKNTASQTIYFTIGEPFPTVLVTAVSVTLILCGCSWFAVLQQA